jgi:hypothetical protein
MSDIPLTSQTEIINLALGHIGQKPVEDITEKSSQANAALKIWNSCLKETLQNHDWSFATIIQTLDLHATYDPAPAGYLYAYAYPANCLVLWRVFNDETTDKILGVRFRVLYDPTSLTKVVLTDAVLAYGEYTFWVDDTSKFDPFFVTALSHRLAAELAMILNGDAEMSKSQIAIFNNMMSEAERINSTENKDTKDLQEERSPLLQSRG